MLHRRSTCTRCMVSWSVGHQVSGHDLAFTSGCCMQWVRPAVNETLLMDFFETQERYRRREMRGWMTLLVRALVIGGCLWLGWLWGHAEQTSLQAEAELVIYENNVKISELSNKNQALHRRLAALRAEKTAGFVSGDNRDDLRRVIAKQIANGVSSEEIVQSIQSLGQPINCRVVEKNDVAVATPLYGGPESKLSLFNGGLNLFIEGSAGQEAQRDTPWFDPSAPIKIRQVFLNGQKTVSGKLPIETILLWLPRRLLPLPNIPVLVIDEFQPLLEPRRLLPADCDIEED